MAFRKSLLLLTLVAAAGTASASSFIATTDALGRALVGTSNVTSDASEGSSDSSRDNKVVLAARDDAASFVASAGEIRSARLEAALQHIRTQSPTLQASDMQLAEAILSL